MMKFITLLSMQVIFLLNPRAIVRVATFYFFIHCATTLFISLLSL